MLERLRNFDPTIVHSSFNNCRFFEVSASSGYNVKESMSNLFDCAMDAFESASAGGATGPPALKGKQ